MIVNNTKNVFADVLFSHGVRHGKLDKYYGFVREILPILIECSDQYVAMCNSLLTSAQIKNILNDILGDMDEKFFRYWLWSIVDFKHANMLINIFKQFTDLCMNYYSISYVKIYSPYELDPQTKEKLELAIKNKNKLKEISTRYIVDPNLIGGVKIVLNSQTFDLTIRNKLNKIKIDSFNLAQTGEYAN